MPRMLVLACVLLFVRPLLAQTDRLPVPSKDSQDDAEKLIRGLFKAEYAKTKSADLIELAKTLLEQGRLEKNSPENRYVFLRESGDVAAKAGDVTQALLAVDELEGKFAVTGAAQRAAIFESAAKAVPAAAAASFVQTALEAAQDAASRDDFPSAQKITKAAETAAQKSTGVALIGRVKNHTKDLEAQQKESVAAEAARVVLKTNPEDAAANTTVGRYLAFYRGDLKNGLAHLAKGSDRPLRDLAVKEATSPTEANKQAELADDWYALAGAVASEKEKAIAQGRAYFWYRMARPEISGLGKVRIDQRLAEFEKRGIDFQGKVAPPANWLVIFRSSDPRIWNKKVSAGPNHQAIEISKVPDNIRFLRLTNVKTGEAVIVNVTHDKLTTVGFTAGPFGWQGLNPANWNSHHLGIIDRDILAPGPGTVPIHIEGNNHYSGWGFGHIRVKEVQGYVWAGKPIPPTIFEFAVSPGPITGSEISKMLSPAFPLPDAGDWIVLFRSGDPKLWGRTVNQGPEKFAVNPLAAPAGTKYVKMTNVKTKDYVIVETTRDQLVKDSDDPGYGWTGSNFYNYNAYHLGIYGPRAAGRGDIAVASVRGGGRDGWGFGHRGFLDDKQGFTWDNTPLDSAVFEIAVKTAPLSAEEQKKLKN